MQILSRIKSRIYLVFVFLWNLSNNSYPFPHIGSDPKQNVKNIIVFIAQLFFLVIFLTNIVVILRSNFFISDFRIFYAAAKLLKTEPTQLYNPEKQYEYQNRLSNAPPLRDGRYFFLPFVNPPFLLLPYIWLTNIPAGPAFKTVMLLMVLHITLNAYVLIRLFSPSKQLLLFLMAVSFAPVSYALFFTQNSFLSLSIFIAVFVLLQKKQNFPAGLVASLLLYKIQLAVVLIAYLLLLRNKKIVMGLAYGALLLFLVNFFLVKGELLPFLNLNFWYMFLHDSQPENAVYSATIQTFFVGLSSLLPQLPTRELSFALGVAAIFVTLKTVGTIKPGSKYFAQAFALLVITTVLTGMHVHYHDVSLLIFPMVYYWSTSRSVKTKAIILLGWLLLQFGISSTRTVLASFVTAAYVICVYLLAGLALLRRGKEATFALSQKV